MSGAGGRVALPPTGAQSPPASPAAPTGLRKAGATVAAENGATPHQLMAIFGWNTLAQAELTSSPPPGRGHLRQAPMQALSLWGGT
jgi:hypothetical protein